MRVKSKVFGNAKEPMYGQQGGAKFCSALLLCPRYCFLTDREWSTFSSLPQLRPCISSLQQRPTYSSNSHVLHRLNY